MSWPYTPFPKAQTNSSSNSWAFLRVLPCTPKFCKSGGKELLKEIFILNYFPSRKQHILLLNTRDCGEGKKSHLKTQKTNHEISNSFFDLCYARCYTIPGIYEVSWFLMLVHVWISGTKLLFCPHCVLKYTSETQYYLNVGEVK